MKVYEGIKEIWSFSTVGVLSESWMVASERDSINYVCSDASLVTSAAIVKQWCIWFGQWVSMFWSEVRLAEE